MRVIITPSNNKPIELKEELYMWSRADLKQRAKNTFKLNYWKCVLVSLVLVLIAGGVGGSSGGAGGSSISSSFTSRFTDTSINSYDDSTYDDNAYDALGLEGIIQKAAGSDQIAVLAMFVLIFIVVFVIVFAFACVIDIFICNPLEIGGKRFYVRNLHEKAQVGNLGFAFDTNNYMNVVKVMFFKDLYVVLWTLLFIIPGIIKEYEYMMVPYLLAENPQMSKDEAFAASKQMMTGNKWRAFVLDFSFIGWHILSVLTCGILEVFYVAPYVDAAHAALYDTLAYGGQNQFTNNASDSIVMENTDNM